jgi:ATP-binding cassette subfamily B protein
MADEKKFTKPQNDGPRGPGGGPRGGYGKPKNLRATILRMFTYIARHPFMLAVALICVVAGSVLNVAATYMMRPIFNDLAAALEQGSAVVPHLLASCLKLLLIYLVSALAVYLQANLMAQLAQKGCNQLRRDLFDKLQELPLSYFDRHTHGELMSRFTNDADNVQIALEQSVVQLLSSVISFVGTVVMMLYLSPILFLVSLVMLAAILIVFQKQGALSRSYYKKQQAALGAVNGNIQEMIEGMKVVKAFTHEEQARNQFHGLNEEYRDAASKANFYSASIMPITAAISNMGYAVTAAVGGALALTGFDIGGLISYLNYSKQLAMPVNQISMQMTTLLSALAGAERIFDVMDAQPEPDDGKVTLTPVELRDGKLVELSDGRGARAWAWKVPTGQSFSLASVAEREDGSLTEVPEGSPGQVWAWKYPSPAAVLDKSLPAWEYHQIRGKVNHDDPSFVLTEVRGAVRLSHVDFSYVEGKPILKQVSVYANPGEKIAFVGSTGAGKTTVTNLINRFYEIQGGMITCDGIDVKDISKDALRLSQGAVLQDTHLFTGTVMDNIRYGRLDATDEDCIQAAKTANADSFIRRLPHGYQTMVTGDGANLSQGQRQLLAIARAAVKDPPVMILDEATSSIDTRTEQHIQQGMDALMDGRTVFVIAHRLSTVRNSDCIVVIEHGEIMEKGSHAQLLEQKGRYYQLYTGQFELD